jgi:hypothetical protein
MCVYSSTVEEAVLGVSVYPCATEQQCDHYEWFYECSCTHGVGVYAGTLQMVGRKGRVKFGESDDERKKNVLYLKCSRELICQRSTVVGWIR